MSLSRRRLVTWRVPESDEIIEICEVCELRLLAEGRWPTNDWGEPFSVVQRGLHRDGRCGICGGVPCPRYRPPEPY